MGWAVNATTRPLYPRERPGTRCIGGWVGLRAGLDRCIKPRPHRDSIPGPSSPQPVAIPTELSQPTNFPSYLAKYECKPNLISFTSKWFWRNLNGLLCHIQTALKINVIRDTTACGSAETYRCFEGACCLHLQNRKNCNSNGAVSIKLSLFF